MSGRPPAIEGRPGAGRVDSVACLLLAVSVLLGAGRSPLAAAQDAPQPFQKAGQEPLEFRGPGREDAEPSVSEVLIGWFGPGTADHPAFGTFWRGASIALEEENAAGGYRGKPFRLVPAWSETPWQAGIVEVTRLVHERGVWAVLGGVDGTTTHLAVQVALKSYFLLLSPGSSDVTADLANVPWLFSLPASDAQIAPVLADAVARANPAGGFVIAAAADHDSHAALVATRRALGARHLVYSALVEFVPGQDEAAAVCGRLLESNPRVVLLLAPSVPGGQLVAALRQHGYGGPIVGGAPLARSAFQRAAGPAAEGVVVPSGVTAGETAEAFSRSYAKRWNATPDEAALRSYDAVRLVAAAVRRAGLNRPRIRDALRALAPWDGAAGPVLWDALGRNRAPVHLAAWRGGALAPLEPVRAPE